MFKDKACIYGRIHGFDDKACIYVRIFGFNDSSCGRIRATFPPLQLYHLSSALVLFHVKSLGQCLDLRLGPQRLFSIPVTDSDSVQYNTMRLTLIHAENADTVVTLKSSVVSVLG